MHDSPSVFFLSSGVLGGFGHSRRHPDGVRGEFARQEIPHPDVAVDLLALLHIDRTDRRPFDQPQTDHFLVDTNTVPHQYVHVVVWNHANRMGTSF